MLHLLARRAFIHPQHQNQHRAPGRVMHPPYPRARRALKKLPQHWEAGRLGVEEGGGRNVADMDVIDLRLEE